MTTYLRGAARLLAALCVCALAVLPAAARAAASSAALDPSGAWHESVLYRFRGPEDAAHGDGAFPESEVVADRAGRLFGTTSVGGLNGNGTVFELVPSPFGDGRWNEIVLHEFQDSGDDGSGPVDRPLLGPDGSLYGTTQDGGAFCHGLSCIGGTVFELTPSVTTGGAWAEQVLLSFSDSGRGGDAPRGDLIADASGALYGTAQLTHMGDAGTVFRLARTRAGISEVVLHEFDGRRPQDGIFPVGGLVSDAAGTLYGTTLQGGNTIGSCSNNGCGLVFSLARDPAHGGVWIERVLYAFTGTGGDGSGPFASLTIDRNGSLYGTTYGGGSTTCQAGCGVVFKLSRSPGVQSAWKETIVHEFGAARGDGYWPVAPLITDDRGTLYGTTLNGGDARCGGRAGCGTAFALVPPRTRRGVWREQVLHRFRGVRRSDGQGPAAGLMFDGSGRLYGTTEIGGGGMCYNGCGTVFMLSPP